ncbi:MAG TPA: hypothetical protein VGL74_01905 [Terriglobales bacterium]|jgi:hypothetical protein
MYKPFLRPAHYAKDRLPGKKSVGCQPLLARDTTERESGPNLGSLLVAFVVSFTVAGSVALGISLAYTSVLALLHAFAHRMQKPRPALVLVHSQSHVSGD